MWTTCDYTESMPGTMIQIRNVPPPIHRQLKARAALAGMSLSDYLLGELRRTLERPTREEVLERIAGRKRVRPRPSSAQVVRELRDRK